MDVLKEKKIDIIEDVAESFRGPKIFTGTEGASLTLFSIGMIKIQTCFYGGIGVIRGDEKLFYAMEKLQADYDPFTTKMYAKRVLMGTALSGLMNHRKGNQFLYFAANFSTQDKEDLYVSAVRGFKAQQNYLMKYRFKPCASMLAFIYDRMANFDYN